MARLVTFAKGVSTCLAAAVIAAGAIAQEAPTPPAGRDQQRRGGQAANPASASSTIVQPERRLPSDSISQHTVELPGRSLNFTATAGSLTQRGDDGRLLAEIGYVAYTMAGSDKAKRPVTFAFNGGPGSASAWLHLGAMGPWRLPLDAANPSPSAPPVLVANAETFLDFTDLVFIDPVGTGFSQIARPQQQQQQPTGTSAPAVSPPTPPAAGGREAGSRSSGGTRYYWSVGGDAESVAEFIRDWITKNGRQTSPKIIVGESYGGIRGPKVVNTLQTTFGVGVNALVLVSPVLDFGVRGSWRGSSPIGLVSVLPSLAAAALEQKGNASNLERGSLAAVEAYAQNEYMLDLLRGPRDGAAVERLIKRVAEFTGLPEIQVRQHGGRIDSGTWRRLANRDSGQQASVYDSTVKSFDPDPSSLFPTSSDDAFTTGFAAPMTSAMTDLYGSRLGYRPERSYVMANRSALREWIYPNSPFPVDATGDLRAIIARDPKLKVLVAHGFTDTITPYFGSVLSLSQLPAFGDPDRPKLVVNPGGHMFYSRDSSRKAFREEVSKILERTHP